MNENNMSGQAGMRAGTGHPSINDFIAVGTKIKMKEYRCWEIIEEVRNNCNDLIHYTI